MIVKIKSHKRPVFGKILKYMMLDKDRLFDKEGKSFAITHNLKGNSIDEWVQQYKANEEFRQRKRKDSVYLTHEILSWHKDDAKHITLSKMETMAREYIRQRNPMGLYVAVPHFDKGHYHIHILASGIEYKTGKSLRLSKENLLRVKKDIQQYQLELFPELSKSVVTHDNLKKAFKSDKEYQVKLRTGRQTEKEKVIGILKICYNKALSVDSFFKLIKEHGLEIYERTSFRTGVIYKNYKFRLNRLGYTPERLITLDRAKDRKMDIRFLRKDKKDRNLLREK